MSQPLKVLAERFWEVYQEKYNEVTETKTKVVFELLPLAEQAAWERVAREACMESLALTHLKKLL